MKTHTITENLILSIINISMEIEPDVETSRSNFNNVIKFRLYPEGLAGGRGPYVVRVKKQRMPLC